MGRYFMNYDDGDIGYVLNDNLALDSKGNFIRRLDNNTVLNMDTGKIHFITGWNDSGDDYGSGSDVDCNLGDEDDGFDLDDSGDDYGSDSDDDCYLGDEDDGFDLDDNDDDFGLGDDFGFDY